MPPLFKWAAYLLKCHTTTTTFKWIKGHSGDLGNKECNQLAKAAVDKQTPDELSLKVPITFDLQGAKLSALTQALAYQGIMKQAPTQFCTTTEENLLTTREVIQAYNGMLETNETLWAGMQKCTLCTCVQQFLFKAMHSMQKVGKYWQHIPNNEYCELCTTCGITESMDHILIHCWATSQWIIWQLTEALWPHATSPGPKSLLAPSLDLKPSPPQTTIPRKTKMIETPGLGLLGQEVHAASFRSCCLKVPTLSGS